jgi:hypothetical protein
MRKPIPATDAAERCAATRLWNIPQRKKGVEIRRENPAFEF